MTGTARARRREGTLAGVAKPEGELVEQPALPGLVELDRLRRPRRLERFDDRFRARQPAEPLDELLAGRPGDLDEAARGSDLGAVAIH
jgi:hypothetical protein